MRVVKWECLFHTRHHNWHLRFLNPSTARKYKPSTRPPRQHSSPSLSAVCRVRSRLHQTCERDVTSTSYRGRRCRLAIESRPSAISSLGARGRQAASSAWHSTSEQVVCPVAYMIREQIEYAVRGVACKNYAIRVSHQALTFRQKLDYTSTLQYRRGLFISEL